MNKQTLQLIASYNYGYKNFHEFNELKILASLQKRNYDLEEGLLNNKIFKIFYTEYTNTSIYLNLILRFDHE